MKGSRKRLRWLILAAAVTAVAVLGIGRAAQATSYSEFVPFYNHAWCANGEGVLNGSQVNLIRCNNYSQQFWTTRSLGGGEYEIVNDLSGRCLEDHNGGGQGSILDTWNCLGNTTQQWSPSTYTGGQPVAWVNAITGLCANMTANNGIDVWPCNFSDSQYEWGPTPFT
jgi:hypothetical protein